MIDGHNVPAAADTRQKPFKFLPQSLLALVHDHLVEISDKRGFRISFLQNPHVAICLYFQRMVSFRPASYPSNLMQTITQETKKV